MDCKKIKIQVYDYIDGYLNGKAKELFEKHIESCSKCNQFVQDMQKTVHMLHAVRQVDLPPSFHDRLKKSLSESAADNKTKIVGMSEIKTRKPVLKRFVQTTATLAACALIVVGVFTGGQHLLSSDSTKEEAGINSFVMDMKGVELAPEETRQTTQAMADNENRSEGNGKTDESEDREPVRMMLTGMNPTYEQACYKINLITDQKEKTLEKVQSLSDTYEGKSDANIDENTRNDNILFYISMPKQNYDSFAQDLLVLKKEGLVSGYIENKLSVIDYGYEVQQIKERIEQFSNDMKTLKENQTIDNSKLIVEKQTELDNLNERLIELEEEVMFINITIEISLQ